MNADEYHQYEIEQQEEIATDPKTLRDFNRYMQRNNIDPLVTQLEQTWERTQTRFKEETKCQTLMK